MLTLSQQCFALLSLPLVASASLLPLATAASLPTFSMAQAALKQPVLVGQRSRIQRVRFASGTNAATLKGSVVLGTRDRYLLGAKKGQTISIKIMSLENNAVFDVIAPPKGTEQRRTLKQEAVTWSSALPETGDYQIVVGATRGNTNYKLQVTIK